MDIGKKIAEVRGKKMSQERLAELTGTTQERISRIESGITEKVDVLLILKIANALDVHPNVFFEEEKPKTPPSLLDTFGQAQYPLVSHIHAGPGTVKTAYSIESYESIEGPSDHKYQGALFFEVKGDSMKPKWEEGDLVLVHPKLKPRNGDYGVVCWDSEEGALKKIFFQKEKFILQSINSHYESVIVEPSSVWFIGKVLWTRHKQ